MKHLDDIEARLKAATSGPWRPWQDDATRRGSAVETAWSHDPEGTDTELITDWCSPTDADLIAHAPDDLTRTTNALRGVLELHKPFTSASGLELCRECGNLSGDFTDRDVVYPCASVCAITEALQGEQ